MDHACQIVLANVWHPPPIFFVVHSFPHNALGKWHLKAFVY